jgi:DNA-binding transcriptional LysR family regulator
MQPSHLSYIPGFVKVVELHSFSKAARALGVTKSAISKQVQGLEESLGVKLLTRTTRTIMLTEQGQAFYDQARVMLETLDYAERSVQQLQARPSGTLRINAPESFGLFHLAPALAQFAATYPEICLDIEFTDRMVNVVEDGVDVAIRVAALADSSLVAKKLAPCQMLLAASPEYLAAHGTPTTPNDLANHRFIEYSYTDKQKELRFSPRKGAIIAAPLNVTMRASSGQMLRQAVLQGLGLVCVPSFIIGNDVKKGKLVQLLPGYTPYPERAIYALYSPTKHMTSKLRLFLDFLGERFTGTPYWEVHPEPSVSLVSEQKLSA